MKKRTIQVNFFDKQTPKMTTRDRAPQTIAGMFR